MDYGYQQLSRIRTSELRAEADRRRLAAQVREARGHAGPGRTTRRSFVAVLVTALLSVAVVVALSSAALARPVKGGDSEYEPGSGPQPGVTTSTDPATSAQPSDLPLLIGGGLLIAAAGAFVASRMRPRAA